jgi:hypothetical protein
MGRSHERKPQLSGSLEPGKAEGELGCHVDYVGPEPGGVVDYVSETGKGPLDIRIQKERDAGRPVHLGPIRLAFGKSIAGRVDPDLMAALLQRPGEPEQGNAHAAYHGPVDLGKQGDAHEIRLWRAVVGDKVGPGPSPLVPC